MTDLHYPDAHIHACNDLEYRQGSFVNAATESDWSDCMRIATEHDGTAFLGIHPWCIGDAILGWEERLRELAEHHPIGIGEIGLDKYKGPSMADQLTCLEKQLDLAMEFRRPVSIHCVKRWGALVESLERRAPFRANLMIHGFCGSAEIQSRLEALGCFLSFGFSLIDGNDAAVDAWKRTPSDKLLLESDAPDALIKRSVERGRYGTEMVTLLESAASLRGVASKRLSEVVIRNASVFLGT